MPFTHLLASAGLIKHHSLDAERIIEVRNGRIIEGDVAVLGITDFAQEELGEVVFVDLPTVGQACSPGDEIGTIESVKAVGVIYTPVAGEIIEVNDATADEPELLNDDPHNEGWLVKIRMSNASDLKSLMKADQYEEYIKSGEA